MSYPAETPSGPIADLTYHGYSGPLHTRAFRWWIVASAQIRLLAKRWWIWLPVVLGVLMWVFEGFLAFAQAQGWFARIGLFPEMPVGQKFAFHVYRGFDNQLFWLFLIALIVGAGSIAADNRTNALLVYLSKPITKTDYLIGKWMSIFLVVFTAAILPALLFYLYCLLAFYSEGFLRDEPFLLFKLIAVAMVPAAFHASLLVGISAWSKSPRLAGATYAGAYFMAGPAKFLIWMLFYRGDLSSGIRVQHVSIDGILEALAQNILGVVLRQPSMHRMRGMEMIELPPPQLALFAALAIGLAVAGVLAARARIRAVEVISG